MKRSKPSRTANIWVARGVPLFLLGITGYASWVVTKVLCIDYLLQSASSSFTAPQVGPAVAILVLYYVLLCVMLVCYARLIYVVTRNPGLVPRGPQWYKEKQRRSGSARSRTGRRKHNRNSLEESKGFELSSSEDQQTTEAVTQKVALDANLRVEDFWQRDVFVCSYDGRPAFCSTCYNWKPDRTHHCSELDRCVLKMDHFCPWVGGVVGETSFKFFVQFTWWGALFCLHVLISTAYYTAQRKQAEGVINVHWAVILGISGLFFLFSGGMCMSNLQFIFINSTTIENLNRKTKVWYLAVYVSEHVLQQLEDRGRSNLRFITYPRPAAEQFQLLEQNGAALSHEAIDNAMEPEYASQPSQASRTFAILETAPGRNPFDLGSKQNFLDLMGTSIAEWLFPISPSPCVRHDSVESFYRMGPVVRQLKQEARIAEDTTGKRTRRKRSRHGQKRPNSQSQSRTSPHDSGVAES